MAIYPLGAAGQFGVTPDTPAHELPPNAWTAGRNIHFRGGSAEKVSGYLSQFGGASIAPYFALSVRALSGDIYWLYAGLVAAYTYELTGAGAGIHTNITRTAGAYTSGDWQGGVLNGVPIINNGVEPPQMWLPVAEATPLIALSAWPANTTAKVIRAYKNYLVALDITKAGVRDSHLVKWSHPASAGAVPSSWDETDPTKDAGEYSLADTEGLVLDCVTLRDSNIIYKDDSIWLMQWIGGSDIFSFKPLFKNVHILGKNCAVEYQSGKHFVLGKSELYTHDGVALTVLGRDKVSIALFEAMEAGSSTRSFVALNTQDTEVWVCYAAIGSTWPNHALIWNWVTGAWGHRDLPQTTCVAEGLLPPPLASNDAWNADASTWASPEIWGSSEIGSLPVRLIITSLADSKLQGIVPWAYNENGTAQTVELERTGLGIPFNTQMPPDISSMKFCREVWPKFSGALGTLVQIRVGAQMDVNGTVAWGAWQDFTIGTTRKVDCTLSGRLFAIGLRSTADGAWKLQGLDVDVVKVGEF